MQFKKAYVLLSGGLDSTTCLHIAMTQSEHVEAISVDYGQRHYRELDYARATCSKHRIEHKVIAIGDILSSKGVMLSDAAMEIPNKSYSEIKGVSPTYVPFRNGTLLSLITAHAQKWVNKQIDDTVSEMMKFGASEDDAKLVATSNMMSSVGIYFGAHADDAADFAYPDCTPEFTGAMSNAITIGSYYTIKLCTPLQWLNKAEIVKKGKELSVDFSKTWSCYKGGEKHCGLCPTCISRKEAFIQALVPDPTDYEHRGET